MIRNIDPRFSRSARVHWILISMLVFATMVFSLVPDLDLSLIKGLYDPARGFRFADNRIVGLIHDGVPIAAKCLGGILLIALGYCFTRTRVSYRVKHFVVFVSLAFVLGPILIVNLGLKDHWGRARPQAVQEFGGTRRYSPPLVLSNQCDSNCAFVSGHAAFGFFLGAPWLLGGRCRWHWMSLGLSVGICFGLARVLQGRHFPSDIVFAFFSVYLGNVLALWMTNRMLPGPSSNPVKSRGH